MGNMGQQLVVGGLADLEFAFVVSVYFVILFPSESKIQFNLNLNSNKDSATDMIQRKAE